MTGPGFDPLTVLYFVLALFPAVILHELAHGWLAIRFGDLTPKRMGRMTLAPRPHIDAFGTVVVPTLLLLPVLFGRFTTPFAYAKPMPIDRSNLPNPDRAQVWIALMGPLSNLILAAPAAITYRFLASGTPIGFGLGGPIAQFLYIWVFTNVLLAVFHIMPIPPLDGARVVSVFLPARARSVFESWEPYGGIFVLVIFFIIPAPVIGFVHAIAEGLLQVFVG